MMKHPPYQKKTFPYIPGPCDPLFHLKKSSDASDFAIFHELNDTVFYRGFQQETPCKWRMNSSTNLGKAKTLLLIIWKKSNRSLLVSSIKCLITYVVTNFFTTILITFVGAVIFTCHWIQLHCSYFCPSELVFLFYIL